MGALAEYQKALQANSQSSLANYRIGEVLFTQRNYQAAVNSYRDAFIGKRLLSEDGQCTLIQVALSTPFLALQTRTTVDRAEARLQQRLKEAGHEAYIVGGAVRDLLLGLRPKDFDVATNATPEQVKSLFRRAFIIGRRFRIVHVVFGRGREHEVIEVSTFRAYLDAAEAEAVGGNERTSKAELAGMQVGDRNCVLPLHDGNVREFFRRIAREVLYGCVVLHHSREDLEE